jgi:hypothetical protein
LAVGAPCRTDDFLPELFFGDFLFARSVKSKISGSSTEEFVSEGIEAESQDGLTLGDFECRFELSFSLQVESPDDTRAIIAE